MEFVEKRIVSEGIVGAGDVLKVDSFLNHRMDIDFLNEVGKAFYDLYKTEGVNKILTIEASGIGIACLTAQYFRCPVVFAKKSRSSNMSGDVFSAKVHSYTRGYDTDVTVSRKYLGCSDRVLVIDDFLAKGSALACLFDIVNQSGAVLVGAGTVIEKEYQGGGNELRAKGYRVESLAKIASMSVEDGVTFCKD